MPSICRRLAAVAFADVAGWTRLVEPNELESLRAWNALRTEVIEPGLQAHGGRLVDLAGDAVFVEFPSAIDAVAWALELQRRPAAATAGGAALRLRIGIHVGDLLVDQQRLVGDAVNVASRIHQTAAPGEIVVTDAVREHVHHRIAVDFLDLGERVLKNLSRPVRIYRLVAEGLRAPDSAEAAVAHSTLLAMQLPGDEAAARSGSAEQEQLERLQRFVEAELLPGQGGRLLQQQGLRLLLDFPQTAGALKAAFAAQQACAQAKAGLSPLPELRPRIGLQRREAAPRSEAAGSADAALALRLAELGASGDIVAGPAVRAELTSVLDADIEDLGERYLEAMDHPVRAYRLAPPAPRPVLDTGADDEALRPTLAVIPFGEHGTGHGALGEILAEELISTLSRAADLNVVSRLSTTAFRGRNESLAEVGLHLKADYVLSGAYRVSSNALRLAAELADARSGRVVWSRELKGSVAAVIEGSDPIADRLVAEAGQAIVARELERARASSLHSLHTCTLLLGAVELMHRLSPRDFHRSREMLQVVAERVPHHAVPQAWLAKWHVLRIWQGWSDDAAADTRLALQNSQRALDNDSHCSLALAMDGFVQTNLLKALDVAEQRYELALRVNPNDALAWSLRGMLHAFKGEGKPAVKATQRGMRLSPLDPHRFFYDALAGGAELAAGHYERAAELTRRSLRANRMHASTFRMLAIALWQLGRHAEAREVVAELLKIEPGLRVSNWLRRSPSSDFPIGRLCAEALRQAGVPD